MTEMIREAVGTRTSAVVLFLLALGITLSVTVLPVWMINADYQEELDGLHQQLSSYQRIAEKDTDLRRYLSRLERAQSSNGHLLRSDSPMVAAAEMQRALEKISDANHMQLISTQIIQSEDDDEGKLKRVAVSVRARGLLDQLVESIHAIEASPTLFFIEDFAMQTANTRRIRGQETQTIFEATFTLVGYMAELQ